MERFFQWMPIKNYEYKWLIKNGLGDLPTINVQLKTIDFK
jgi:hypothetical protein